jgi:uncharacterized iron-regulated membrane protein
MIAIHSWLLVFHRWAGVLSAAFLVIVAVSGAVLVFEFEIDRALNPGTSYVERAGRLQTVESMIGRVHAERPGERVISVRLPEHEGISYELALRSRLLAYVDPYSGRLLGVRDRERSFARFVHLLHTRFVMGRAGELFVGWLTVLTLFMSATGLVLWWPRRILSVGRRQSWRRTNFDLHNVLGFWASVVIFVISLTGVIIAFESVTDPLIARLDPPGVDVSSLTSAPAAGRTRLSVDEALRIARLSLPGAFAAVSNVPQSPTDIYRVLLKFPEDRTPAGRSRVYLDQYSGAVLHIQNTRTAPAGTRLLNLKRSAHTGDIYGAPTQALFFIGSLALAGQIVTGVLIWWRPRRHEAPALASTGQAAGARRVRPGRA